MSAHQTFFAFVKDNFNDQKVIEISFEKADPYARRKMLNDDEFGYSTATKAGKRQNFEIDPFTEEYNEQLVKRRTVCGKFSDQLERNEERKKKMMKKALSLCVEYLKE